MTAYGEVQHFNLVRVGVGFRGEHSIVLARVRWMAPACIEKVEGLGMHVAHPGGEDRNDVYVWPGAFDGQYVTCPVPLRRGPSPPNRPALIHWLHAHDCEGSVAGEDVEEEGPSWAEDGAPIGESDDD